VSREDTDVRTFAEASRITDIVLSRVCDTPHDGVVHTTLPAAALTPVGERRGASTRNAAVDLEWFWPSRRGHAFDEFCR
jgi:hypothetical protein